MQKQEEQSAYVQWDDLRQHEAQQKGLEKGLVKFPFSSTTKNFFVTRNIDANLQTSNWVFSKDHISPMTAVMQTWIESYLGLNLAGLTVLDVGAGEGETAKFFLDHGAAKVICIEPSTQAYRHLARNVAEYPTVLPIKKRFSLSDLHLPHDFLKCNIEGCEEKLLDANLTVPAIVEVHSLQLRDKFKQAGWRIYNNNNLNDYGCTSYAYWMC